MADLAGARMVVLGAMDSDDGLKLLANIVGWSRVSQDPAAAREVVRLCGGVPLAIRAAATRLASAHAWPLAKMAARLGGGSSFLEEMSLCGADVLAIFESSYRWLTPADQGVFRLLSLLGDREFSAAGAAHLLGCDLAAAEAHLARLVECHLLEMAPGCDAAPDVRYRYHKLARVCARARLGEVLDDVALAFPAASPPARAGRWPGAPAGPGTPGAPGGPAGLVSSPVSEVAGG